MKYDALCLDAICDSADPTVKEVYRQMLREEGVHGLGMDRALLRTALQFRNRLPKRMQLPLVRACREIGVAV